MEQSGITNDERDAAFAKRVQESRDAGFDAYCLLGCNQGFNGPDCPRCWPPSEERVMRVNGASISALDVYAFCCSRIGATQNGQDARLWFAVRDALDAAVRDSTWIPAVVR